MSLISADHEKEYITSGLGFLKRCNYIIRKTLTVMVYSNHRISI